MIKIDFHEPDTDNWKKWLAQCEDEQRKYNIAIEAGENPKVKGDVYKGKKYDIKPEFYLKLDGPFHGKCVYCESVVKDTQPVDIEHFRPKKSVVDEDGNNIMANGYYWLVYDYHNLLPSCRNCNKIPEKNNPERYGKGNQFPVKDFRATSPGEEREEIPLLINPVFEDPEEHFRYDEDGFLHHKTDMGKTCIDVFGLNKRETLVDARKAMYRNARDKAAFVMFSVMNNYPDKQERLNEFWKIWKGYSPYSAAGRAAIMDRLNGDTLSLLLELYEKLRENE